MISRRFILGLLPAFLVTPARADDHPSVAYMNRVGEELLHAHRLGTASAFARVVHRYGDINSIADNSLSDFEVPDGERGRLVQGIIKYIALYMATSGKDYPIAKFEIGEARVDKDKNVVVDSKVFLMAGQTYSVSWKLNWVGGTYKIADATVVGFSMVNMEKRQFANFIQNNNGNVKALIDRLNSFG